MLKGIHTIEFISVFFIFHFQVAFLWYFLPTKYHNFCATFTVQIVKYSAISGNAGYIF